jgi:hypothetical protein
VEGVAVPEHLAEVGKKLLHFGVLESRIGKINYIKLDRLVQNLIKKENSLTRGLNMVSMF